jgi:hypothetical protein
MRAAFVALLGALATASPARAARARATAPCTSARRAGSWVA